MQTEANYLKYRTMMGLFQVKNEGENLKKNIENNYGNKLKVKL